MALPSKSRIFRSRSAHVKPLGHHGLNLKLFITHDSTAHLTPPKAHGKFHVSSHYLSNNCPPNGRALQP